MMRHRRILLTAIALAAGIAALSGCSTQEVLTATPTPPQLVISRPTLAPTRTSTALPTITPTLAPTPSPTPIPMPVDFTVVDPYESVAQSDFPGPKFSIRVPTDWANGWLVDSGAVAYTSLPTAVTGQSPNDIGILIFVGEGINRDLLLDYPQSVARGTMIEDPVEETRGDMTFYGTVFSDGERMAITTVIWGSDPDQGLFAMGFLPHAQVDLYRPLVEEIIFSIVFMEINGVP